MSRLFETTVINGMKIDNRFVRSATWEGMAADDGGVTPKLEETYAALAAGGAGMIITSHAYIRKDGQATPKQIGIYKNELIPGLYSLTYAVHERGGRVVAQLAHAGTFAAEQLLEQPPLAVSNYEGLSKMPRREITGQDIDGIVSDYGRAAARARAAGFDGVQLHAAHGYLLSQFLSPAFNRRKDGYGGAIDNRVRVCLEAIRAVRASVGKDYPVLIKLNCSDFIEGGMELEDSLRTAEMLAGAGADAIELSGGTIVSGKLSPSRTKIDTEEKEAYFRQEAAVIKKRISIPLILVGGMRSFAVADRLVNEDAADYISMSRPFIREPGLVNRWKAGDLRRAACVSDNLCFKPALEGKGIYCVTEEREKK